MGAEAGVEPANRGPEPREFPLFYSASEVMAGSGSASSLRAEALTFPAPDSALCPPSVLSIVDNAQAVNP